MQDVSHGDILKAVGEVREDVASMSNQLRTNSATLEKLNDRMTTVEQTAAEERGALKFGKWFLGLALAIGGLGIAAIKLFQSNGP